MKFLSSKNVKRFGTALICLVLAWIFFLSYVRTPNLPAILIAISLLGFAIINIKYSLPKKTAKKKVAAKKK
jgi:hypothetical protein